MIDWLQNWYAGQCDGDWEHEFGIKIETIDNPGWSITIDLTGTKLERLTIPHTLIEKSEDDWMGSITDNVFKGIGSPQKFNSILAVFKEIWSSNVI